MRCRGASRASRAGHCVTQGQSLVEFALVVPVMLGLFGGAIDLARLYHTWISLEASTRDAAEYAATNDTTYGAAATDAQKVVCSEFGQSATCSDPSVSVTSFSLSTTQAGASTSHPIATATIATSTSFRTLFPYPFLSQQTLTLSSTRSFSIVQGR